MVQKFAEHFHDSWASKKFEKGWTQGEIYSRVNLTHPRLKAFGQLKEVEKSFYKERCNECIKALMAYGYRIELTDQESGRRTQAVTQVQKFSSPNFQSKISRKFCGPNLNFGFFYFGSQTFLVIQNFFFMKEK